jgi:NAD(P)-dependent dehydrogenase (short-subunit alcohol dehydrogenase family)
VELSHARVGEGPPLRPADAWREAPHRVGNLLRSCSHASPPRRRGYPRRSTSGPEPARPGYHGADAAFHGCCAARHAYTATKHAVTGLTKVTALDGRQYDIACGYMASLPLDANALFVTGLATKMPFVGRG